MVPGVVADRIVLYRGADVAATLMGFEAYPTGLSMTLHVTGRGPFWNIAIPVHGHQPGPLLRFGMAMSDGRRATFDGWRRPPPMWDDTPDMVLLPRGGGGGSDRPWQMRFWLWPLPPPGDLTFAVEWASGDIPESVVTVDSAPFRDAAGEAFTL